MPKQDKKAKKRTKQSVEDNEEKIEEYIQEEPKRAKIDEDEEDVIYNYLLRLYYTFFIHLQTIFPLHFLLDFNWRINFPYAFFNFIENIFIINITIVLLFY